MSGPRIGIVGAGILGLAVARRLASAAPGAMVTVIDKEPRVAVHQTGHNSGVVHAGIYYAPGSLKARLCARGRELLRDYCHEHGLPYEECGKLIVARDAGEQPRLDELERRSAANGVPAVRRLTAAQLGEVEPHVRGVAALHSPHTAIVDFVAVAEAFADELVAQGAQLRFGFEVVGLSRAGGETRVRGASSEELVFDRLVVCGGLQSDRLARMAGDEPQPRIVPFRGEYYRLLPARTELVRALIYPVPDPRYPFLGVHFTRRIGGGVDIGPNAVLALAREGYSRRDLSASDMAELLRSGAFMRLARRHWRMGARELYGSLSKRAFVAEARTFVPALTVEDVVTAPAGIRAQAVDDDGSLVDDFRITDRDGTLLVRNAPSPAATSSLAIAEYVVEQLAP